MKTPGEVKRGLDECTRLGGCVACPYFVDNTMAQCTPKLAADALAYIRQLEAKIAKYEKPLVPLTFEEAILCDSCLETIDGEYCGMALNEFAWRGPDECDGYILFCTHADGEAKYMRADYGRTWRCWSRKPTEAERKAAKWDE